MTRWMDADIQEYEREFVCLSVCMFFEVIIIIIAFGILGDVIKIQPLLNYDFIFSPINLDNLNLMQVYVYMLV